MPFPPGSIASSSALQPGQFSQDRGMRCRYLAGRARQCGGSKCLTEQLLAQRDGFAMLLLHAELVDEDEDGDEDEAFRPLR